LYTSQSAPNLDFVHATSESQTQRVDPKNKAVKPLLVCRSYR